MDLFNLNSDKITLNIDGRDIVMKHPICFGKVYDKWLVSKCGKVWSLHFKKLISGRPDTYGYWRLDINTPKGFWEDGSGYVGYDRLDLNTECRGIKIHKMVIDTWAPLWDNPPKGVTMEQWEIVRELDTIYDYFTKSGSIDHIDNDKTNNHIDNLRRTNDWDNNKQRKSKGI